MAIGRSCLVYFECSSSIIDQIHSIFMFCFVFILPESSYLQEGAQCAHGPRERHPLGLCSAQTAP